MAAKLNITLEGTEEMKRVMREFRNDAFKKKVLTATFRKAAKPFVAQARANAPKADKVAIQSRKGGKKHEVNPGTLAKSIGAWTYRKVEAPHLFMGAKFGKRSLKYDGWYYRFVEFGTVFQSAQPFLQPAWDATKGMANQIMATEFDGIFNKFKQKYKL